MRRLLRGGPPVVLAAVLLAGGVVSGVAGSGGSAGASVATWTVVDLIGTSCSGGPSYVGMAFDVNDRGQVVGNAGACSVGGFLWQNAKLTPLGLSDARAIDERGRIAGTSRGRGVAVVWQAGRKVALTDGESRSIGLDERGRVIGVRTVARATGVSQAFLWQQGRTTGLGALGGQASASTPTDINNLGQIVGASWTRSTNPFAPDPVGHAFLWQKGRMIDLGTLGGPESKATAINDRGEVVGWADTKGRDPLTRRPARHAFLWRRGKMVDLGTLGGAASEAADISEKGQVVGWAYTNDAVIPGLHAFIWQNGKMRDLGALGGSSEAVAINERGQVAGHVGLLPGESPVARHAFVWQNGTMTRLPDLPGAFAMTVLGVNARGQVVGYATRTSGASPAVLWTTTR